MKVLVGAFNQEKALIGAFSVIVQPVVEPMDRFTALKNTHNVQLSQLLHLHRQAPDGAAVEQRARGRVPPAQQTGVQGLQQGHRHHAHQRQRQEGEGGVESRDVKGTAQNFTMHNAQDTKWAFRHIRYVDSDS